MEKLLFGCSGLPLGDGTRRFTNASALPYVRSLGLDALELLFVRSVTVTDRNHDAIVAEARRHNVYLSAHGSYYVNLNAETPELQAASLARLQAGAEALRKVGGRSLVFHAGFYLESSREEAYAAIRDNLRKLPDLGVDYRLETTGKNTQFGTLEELVRLCKEVATCKLCLDFSHVHARNQGSLKGYRDFAALLQYVHDELGRPALDDLHVHLAGIQYGAKGERKHLPLGEGDFPYRECLKALKDFDVKGCVIAEGPLVEKDAVVLKKAYEDL